MWTDLSISVEFFAWWNSNCTISPIMGENLLIRAPRNNARETRIESGVHQQVITGSLNNLTATMTTHIEAMLVLKGLEDMANWIRMKFKAKSQGAW